jgi:hypothetical protein
VHRAAAPPTPFIEILLVNPSYVLEMPVQRFDRGGRQHCISVLEALGVANGDGPALDVHVLDPEPEAFEEAESGPMHGERHQQLFPGQMPEDGRDLVARHHDGQSPRLAGANDVHELPDLAVEEVAVEKQQRAQCLVLGRGADVAFNRQVCQEGVDLGLRQLRGMTQVVKADEAARPHHTGLFGSPAVVT